MENADVLREGAVLPSMRAVVTAQTRCSLQIKQEVLWTDRAERTFNRVSRTLKSWEPMMLHGSRACSFISN